MKKIEKIILFALSLGMWPSLLDSAAETLGDGTKSEMAIEKELGCHKFISDSDASEGNSYVFIHYNGANKEKYTLKAEWCEVDGSNYLLYFSRNDKLFHPECSPVIHWYSYPKGLSVINSPESLKKYSEMKEDKDNGDFEKQNQRSSIVLSGNTKNPIIRDGISLEAHFYCLKGRWFFSIKD